MGTFTKSHMWWGEDIFIREDQDKRLTKFKSLLNKLKHQEKSGIAVVSSNIKSFVQGQKVNRQKIDGCQKSSKRYQQSYTKKFAASLMILGVVTSEDDLVPQHFFLQSARINTTAYTEKLNLSIISEARGRQYVFKKHSALSHATQ